MQRAFLEYTESIKVNPGIHEAFRKSVMDFGTLWIFMYNII